MERSQPDQLRIWEFDETIWPLGTTPKLMGIVNVTPDSFSDGGRYLQTGAAVDHALDLVRQGADLLDVGGESTRPGAAPVDPDEELRRVIPVIQELARQTEIPISIDTRKSRVAREALAAGAVIVNDVSAATHDPEMLSVCADSQCGLILMHMQGTPQTMQENPIYNDVVQEVFCYLNERLAHCKTLGIRTERVVFDPGIGFGKRSEHNLALLQNIAVLRGSGRPVLIGHSRKRFLQSLLGRPVDERLAGTIGLSIALAMQSTDLLRVHDVAAVRDALTAWQALLPDR